MLKPDEREKFMKALDNPESELAQQLLASEELDSNRVDPWWEAPIFEEESPNHTNKRFGKKPELMALPSALPKIPSTGSPLLYNICALW